MTLPTLSKTWIFKTNIIIPTTGSAITDIQQMHYQIKKALTTASGWTDASGNAVTNSYPWTVVASCGVSGGTYTADATDRWASYANVNQDGTHLAWIVLQQAQVNPNYQIAYGCVPSSNYGMNMAGSFSVGYSAPWSTTAFPTAPSDAYTSTATTGYGSGNTVFDSVLHIMMSTDGQCTRVILMVSNACRVFWVFDKPKSPVTGWTNPAIILMPQNSSSTDMATISRLTNANSYVNGYNGGLMTMYVTTEFYGSGAIGTQIITWNQISSEWPATPAGLLSVTSGKYGRHGELYDIWFSSVMLAAGDTFPATGARNMVYIPNLILPWNTTDCLTT